MPILNAEKIAQREISNKVEGSISYLAGDKGFIKGEDQIGNFFSKQYVIDSDAYKTLWINKRVKFNPSLLGDSKMATEIEII